MRRYIRIYWQMMKMSFATLLAYRSNLINNTLSSLAWAALTFVSIYLITSKSPNVYGWTREQLILLTAVYSLMIGAFHALFTGNFEELATRISYGQLDGLLVKPIDVQFSATCGKIRYTPFVRIIAAAVVIGLILQEMNVVVTMPMFILFLLFTIAGLMILYSLWLITSTLLIWNPRLTNLIDVLFSVSSMARYPGEMYSHVHITVYALVFPLTFVSVVPVKALTGMVSGSDIGWLMGLAIGLFMVSRLFWMRALRSYASSSG